MPYGANSINIAEIDAAAEKLRRCAVLAQSIEEDLGECRAILEGAVSDSTGFEAVFRELDGIISLFHKCSDDMLPISGTLFGVIEAYQDAERNAASILDCSGGMYRETKDVAAADILPSGRTGSVTTSVVNGCTAVNEEWLSALAAAWEMRRETA